jgi:hypothetical protein
MTRSHPSLSRLFRLWPVLPLIAMTMPVQAVTITFDYRFDTAGFFDANPQARTALEAAGRVFEHRLTDSLAAIVPDAQNTWNMYFHRPDTDALGQWVINPTVPVDTLWVFVGARDLPAGVLGETSSGGYAASGFQPWFDLLDARGQPNASGPNATDFGPWGGAIAFDVNGDMDGDSGGWHFDHHTAVTPGASDFYSVALRELAHLLGVGIADSWHRLVVGSLFIGPEAVAAHDNAPVPLADSGHWADDLTSTFAGWPQEAAMTRFLTTGTRKHMTDLDWAALADIGWELAPPPIPGDLNGDGLVNTADINPFILALTDPPAFTAAFPHVDRAAAGDLNGDGLVNTADINPFVLALTSGNQPGVIPEPATLALLAAAVLIGTRRPYPRRHL